jgi:hypothetical protein
MDNTDRCPPPAGRPCNSGCQDFLQGAWLNGSLVLNLAQPRFGFSSHLARVKVDDGAVILREEPVHVCGSPQPFGVSVIEDGRSCCQGQGLPRTCRSLHQLNLHGCSNRQKRPLQLKNHGDDKRQVASLVGQATCVFDPEHNVVLELIMGTAYQSDDSPFTILQPTAGINRQGGSVTLGVASSRRRALRLAATERFPSASGG